MRATQVLAAFCVLATISQSAAVAQLADSNASGAKVVSTSTSTSISVGEATTVSLRTIPLPAALANSRSSVIPASTESISRRQREDNNSVLGALMLCGGGPLPHNLMETFFELGQAGQGSLVIIPSASSMADQGDFTWTLNQWQQFPWASVRVLHAQNREQIESDIDFVKPLQEATAVWISGGDQRRLAERYLGTPVERELKKVVNRGGIIGGTSAGSAIASRVMISGGREQPVIASGMDLLPGAIIDQHFSQRKRHVRLASAVQQHPDRVGIGIDESTGLVVSKKEARVLGMGSVYVYSQTETTTEAFEPLRFESGTAFSLPEYSVRQE